MQLSSEEKRFWVPTMIGVGAAISFLGVSVISGFGLRTWAGWVDIGIGLGLVWCGIIWYGKSRREAQSKSSSSFEGGSDRRGIHYKDIHHEVLTDKQGPYYMGDSVGLQVKLTNLLDEACTREFFYLIQLPDGMRLNRPLYPIHFAPREEKVIPLGDPVFLAFLGTFRLVIVTDEAERLLIEEKTMPSEITFQALFAAYSRDREAHQLQKQIRFLTWVLVVLTAVLIGLMVTLS